MCGVPSGVRPVLDRAPVELDGAAEVGVDHVLHALVADLGGQLDDRHHLRAGALGDVHGVPEVVGVAVGEEDMGGLELGGLHRGQRVPRQEGIDEHTGVALSELEAGLSEEADLHCGSPWSGYGGGAR